MCAQTEVADATGNPRYNLNSLWTTPRNVGRVLRKWSNWFEKWEGWAPINFRLAPLLRRLCHIHQSYPVKGSVSFLRSSNIWSFIYSLVRFVAVLTTSPCAVLFYFLFFGIHFNVRKRKPLFENCNSVESGQNTPNTVTRMSATERNTGNSIFSVLLDTVCFYWGYSLTEIPVWKTYFKLQLISFFLHFLTFSRSASVISVKLIFFHHYYNLYQSEVLQPAVNQSVENLPVKTFFQWRGDKIAQFPWTFTHWSILFSFWYWRHVHGAVWSTSYALNSCLVFSF